MAVAAAVAVVGWADIGSFRCCYSVESDNCSIERLRYLHCAALCDQKSLSADLFLAECSDMDWQMIVAEAEAVSVSVSVVLGVVVVAAAAANCYNCMDMHSFAAQRLVAAADSVFGPFEIVDCADRLVLVVVVVLLVVLSFDL